MGRAEVVAVPLSDESGSEKATLTLWCPPGHTSPPLWDFSDNQGNEPSLLPIRVLEGEEYVYKLSELASADPVTTDKPEVFLPDYRNGISGRFRPGLSVGELSVRFYQGESFLGRVQLEVMSRKLDYLSDYRTMLNDIVGYVADVISDRFAPSQQRFAPVSGKTLATLYQQFAFLRAFLSSDQFRAALSQIVRSPHRRWGIDEEQRPAAQGMRHRSNAVKALLSSGPRIPWVKSPLPIKSIPAVIATPIYKETVDSPENRFIFSILVHWRDLLYDVRRKLSTAPEGHAKQRGIREVDETIALLAHSLSLSLFKELGPVTFTPIMSPVLHGRAGYRELYRAYIQAELAAQLSWDGGDDVYGAGKKNVAVLYEYWTFLKLAEIASELCGLKPIALERLLESTPDGLSLRLRKGRRLALRGVTGDSTNRVTLTLFYNRSFPPSENTNQGSWSREMMPDMSIRLKPEIADVPDTWIHFDAKYRIENIKELFGPETGAYDAARERVLSLRYKREDLITMHAYKDAVRRSTGAYILYPGNQKRTFSEYESIVPGIGAFPLCPSEEGTKGQSTLLSFLSDVIRVVGNRREANEPN